MKEKVALYSLGIGILAVGGSIFNYLANGKPIVLERLTLVLILAPLFGYFIWLRWDWAPAKRREKLQRQRREEGN